jgi:hypothetical protein
VVRYFRATPVAANVTPTTLTASAAAAITPTALTAATAAAAAAVRPDLSGGGDTCNRRCGSRGAAFTANTA